MGNTQSEILVIGAGMAGLACAIKLAAAGRSVTVIDKGRGPGGRMAARRTEIGGETVSFDHGAQYFTARDPGFRAAVQAWQSAGAVAPWAAAGDEAFVGVPGMNGPIKAMAQDLDVRWNTRAERLERSGDGWLIETDQGAIRAKTVLIAIPAEQSHTLLAGVHSEYAAAASQVVSEPCWAVMAGFDERLAIASDTARDPDGAISWAARNSAKPARAGEECWVLHASPARSREILDRPKDEAAQLLLKDFFRQCGIEPAEPLHLAAHRWLYAMPAALQGDHARFDPSGRIGIAGDYLHSPRVEGAWISGTMLAERVLDPA